MLVRPVGVTFRDHRSSTVHGSAEHGGIAMAAPGTQPIDSGPWPRSMPLADWQATRDTLHMWRQMGGKTRLALPPRQDHWRHLTPYVTARGPPPARGAPRAPTLAVHVDLLP